MPQWSKTFLSGTNLNYPPHPHPPNRADKTLHELENTGKHLQKSGVLSRGVSVFATIVIVINPIFFKIGNLNPNPKP